MTYAASGRRLSERDRHGHDLARLSWRDDGTLASASLCIPDGSWITIEPRATSETGWGQADRVWHDGTPLTVFTAVDYDQIAVIPSLAEPARLPPGAGTAIFNLIAGLASDQRRPSLTYDGPFPSEDLFLVLLESFQFEEGAADPLQAFRAGTLSWTPAPHERHLTPAGAWIQRRGRIEKITWDGRAYYRPDWQGVGRHAPRRIRDSDGGVVCSLWAFEGPIEDHLRVDAEGETLTVLGVDPPSPSVLPATPAVLAGLAAVVAARSVSVLGPIIMDDVASLTLEWGPLTLDLVTIDGDRLRLSNRLLPLVRARQAAASTPDERTGVAVANLAELAHVAGDHLRQRAQARLAARPPSEQQAILEADVSLADTEIARAITGAVRALMAAV